MEGRKRPVSPSGPRQHPSTWSGCRHSAISEPKPEQTAQRPCALAQHREANLFLRGIVPSLGFRTDEVYYSRKERMAGESKYPLSKMVALAAEGVTSFSVEPMHAMTVVGLVSLVVALVMLVYTIVSCATGNAVAGWGSIMVSIWLVGGLVITSLGVTGEYVGKAYLETKRRPRYIVDVELD